jgi:phage terminase large subunit
MEKNQTVIEIPEEFERLFDTDWREAAIYGGRFSLKSHTVARYLLIRARMAKTRILCAREYQISIAESSHQLLSDLIRFYGLNDFKVTDKSIVNTQTGSEFIFKGLHHNEQGIKSIEGVDIAWVEEAQTITQNSLEILTPTVRKDGSQIIYTYNRLLEDDPVHVRLVIEGRPNTLFIIVNYDIALKYGWMPDVIRLEMESDRDHRPTLYKVKWLGQPSSVEGRIFKDWQMIESIPHEAKKIGRGLDFGYSVDPTACIDIYEYNGGYIFDELIYRKGMSNSEIATALKEGDIITVADSAEPKSIDELKAYGLTVVPAEKGADSVLHGIQLMQGLKISVTSRSQNLWQEYNRLMWDRDRNGVWLQRPENGNDHAIDGCRYFLQRHLKKNQNDTKEFYEKLKMKQYGYKFASTPRAKPKAGLR